jgi:hypothetical protein
MKKELIYRNATLSFIVINFWSLYCFFDYFTDKAAVFRGLGVYFDFFFTTLFCIATGVILLLLRLLVFKKNKGYKLKNNIFYLFIGIFNFNVFVIWIIIFTLQLIQLKIDALYYPIGNIIISGIILSDTFELNTKIKELKSTREKTT